VGPHEERLRALLAASGAPIDETYVLAHRFRNGRAVAYAIARDREEALPRRRPSALSDE
jgi:ketosteroid isomerase-like protein